MENMYVFLVVFILHFCVFTKNTSLASTGVTDIFGDQDQSTSLAKKKSAEVLKKLRQVTSMAQFLEAFKLEESLTYKKVVVRRPGGTLATKFIFQKKFIAGTSTYDLQGRSQNNDEFSPPKVVPCKPHPRPFETNTIKLPRNAKLLNGIIYPACVEYQQCGGCCPDKLSCQPTSFNVTEIDLFRFTVEGEVITFTYNLTEHASCECQCKVKKEECEGNQTYNEESCECKCPQKVGNCQNNKQWSPSACDCVCSEDKPTCDRGDETWNKEKCQCECDASKLEACPAGKIRNISLCECK